MIGGRILGSVRVVGAGLIGTSIGLALTKLGVDVILSDSSPGNVRLAVDYGAGRIPKTDDTPVLIVICVPPDVTARLVADELSNFPHAIVTDVASVKASILSELSNMGADLSRYVGSHPMAGREKGGAASARADIFVARPWVIAGTPSSSGKAIALVESLALDLESVPIRMNPVEHDQSVALVSHVPQIISSLLAARLVGASGIELAGQGLRDTVRIAASDPALWVQILQANSSEIIGILRSFEGDLNKVIGALAEPGAPGSLAALDQTLKAGNNGIQALPGKHGTAKPQYQNYVVMIEDRAGELARLFNEIGEIGINVEDLKLEHSPGAPIGLVEVSVLPEFGERLVADLTDRGWRFA